MTRRRESSAASAATRRMLWRFAPMIYGPTALFGLGEGAILPLLPVMATELGADVAQAALVTSLIVLARLLGNLPAGWLVGRIGERLTMAFAGCLALLGALGLVFGRSLLLLSASVFFIGLCAAAFGLARHAFMTTRVPLAYRARALSMLGGSFRAGMLVGPFVAAGFLAAWGDEHTVGWFFVACLVTMIALVLFGTDPETALPRTGAGLALAPPAPSTGMLRTVHRHRGVLARLGLSAATLSAMRQARVHLLPLWGVSLALDPQTIAVVVGVTGALEFALFYSSGQIMDRWGRLWACLPSMVLMGGAFVGLSFTHDRADSLHWFAVAAIVVGIGNGLSSGILMTLGADVAPSPHPAGFLGAWRTLTDAGAAGAPLLVAAVTAAASLPIATGAIGAVGLVGALGFLRYVPRYVPFEHR